MQQGNQAVQFITLKTSSACYRIGATSTVGCGESRSPVLSPGSKEPRRETGPAAMGHPAHPPWGSSMGFT